MDGGNVPATPGCDHRAMNELTASSASTASAALEARDRVELLARDAGRDERASARLAKAAIFEEALLGALKARFAELRSVAK